MEALQQSADAVFAPLGMIQAGMIAALAVLAFAIALHVLLRRPDRLDAAALAQLAARRGWRIARHMATAGKGFRLAVTPQDGALWSCHVTRYINVGQGGSLRTTLFEDAATRLPAGLVLIGPGLSDVEIKAVEALVGGASGHGLARILLAHLMGEAAAPGDLRLCQTARLPGATIFATTEIAAEALPAVAGAWAPLLAGWRRDRPAPEAFPILILGASGLKVRLRTDADTAGALEAFLDLALAVRGTLAARRSPAEGAGPHERDRPGGGT